MFSFYGTHFKVVDTGGGDYILGVANKVAFLSIPFTFPLSLSPSLSQNEVCVAYQFKSVWFVVYAQVKKGGSIVSPLGAFTLIMKRVWQDLLDNGL